jgi:hypothetical protein
MVAFCPKLTCLAKHKPSTCLQGSGWFSRSNHLPTGDKLNWTSSAFPRLHATDAKNEKWIRFLDLILSSSEHHAGIQSGICIALLTMHYYRWSWLVWNEPPLLSGPLLPRWSHNRLECKANRLWSPSQYLPTSIEESATAATNLWACNALNLGVEFFFFNTQQIQALLSFLFCFAPSFH